MNSLVESCTPLKNKYDDCFNSWFKDYYLKGKGNEKTHNASCGKLFSVYQSCLTVSRYYQQLERRGPFPYLLQEGLEKQNISKEELKKDILGTENDKFL